MRLKQHVFLAGFLINFVPEMRRILCISLMLLAGITAMNGQNPKNSKTSRKEAVLQAMIEQQQYEFAREKRVALQGGGFLHYLIEDGDTVYIDNIQPVWCFPKGVKPKAMDWRRYYKLIYNFNKVYPYALLGRRLVQEVDFNIAAKDMNRLQKEHYITQMQWELLHDFEDAVRHMTISQGKLLVRLVDREIGKSSFQIVKDYKNGLAAGFWQGVAKLFGQNLKTRYDPQGEDRLTEFLIQKWERGEFDALYFSVFMEMPKRTVIPSKYMQDDPSNQSLSSSSRAPEGNASSK